MEASRVVTSNHQQELLAELDTIEIAIGRSRTFRRGTDAQGVVRILVSPELLVLAEREHLIVTKLRRSLRTPRRPPIPGSATSTGGEASRVQRVVG